MIGNHVGMVSLLQNGGVLIFHMLGIPEIWLATSGSHFPSFQASAPTSASHSRSAKCESQARKQKGVHLHPLANCVTHIPYPVVALECHTLCAASPGVTCETGVAVNPMASPCLGMKDSVVTPSPFHSQVQTCVGKGVLQRCANPA